MHSRFVYITTHTSTFVTALYYSIVLLYTYTMHVCMHVFNIIIAFYNNCGVDIQNTQSCMEEKEDWE